MSGSSTASALRWRSSKCRRRPSMAGTRSSDLLRQLDAHQLRSLGCHRHPRAGDRHDPDPAKAKWYHIRCEMSLDSELLDVLIDGTPVVTDHANVRRPSQVPGPRGMGCRGLRRSRHLKGYPRRCASRRPPRTRAFRDGDGKRRRRTLQRRGGQPRRLLVDGEAVASKHVESLCLLLGYQYERAARPDHTINFGYYDVDGKFADPLEPERSLARSTRTPTCKLRSDRLGRYGTSEATTRRMASMR